MCIVSPKGMLCLLDGIKPEQDLYYTRNNHYATIFTYYIASVGQEMAGLKPG